MTRGKQTKKKQQLDATVGQLSAGIARVGEKGSTPAPAKKKMQMNSYAVCIVCVSIYGIQLCIFWPQQPGAREVMSRSA